MNLKVVATVVVLLLASCSKKSAYTIKRETIISKLFSLHDEILKNKFNDDFKITHSNLIINFKDDSGRVVESGRVIIALKENIFLEKDNFFPERRRLVMFCTLNIGINEDEYYCLTENRVVTPVSAEKIRKWTSIIMKNDLNEKNKKGPTRF